MNMKNISDLSSSRWSGGITRELYRDKDNFSIRISCAEIDPGESYFSDYTGYERILKILKNNVVLTRDNEVIHLDPVNIFKFNGSDKIKSKNQKKVLDFNVIYKKENLLYFRETQNKISLNFEEKILIFSKENSNYIHINNKKISMNEHDFIIFSKQQELVLEGSFIIVSFRT